MAKMVDVGGKELVKRKAVASGELILRPRTLSTIKSGRVQKGDVLRVAEIAALQAVKNTSNVLPHCHQIPITSASVDLKVGARSVVAVVRVEATYKTGVEMEAIYGVTVALSTVWDMVKSLEKDGKGQYPTTMMMNIKVLSKVKGLD